MEDSASTQGLRWYQGVPRYCWLVLAIAALGWLFDTMDQNIFNLVRAPSLNDLLGPHFSGEELKAQVKNVSGIVTAVFLIGWAVGGFVFGILGDRIGRTGTMVLTILIYAIFTGLSGAPFVTNWETYAVMRFLTAVGVGGEWAAGASLVAEVFPERSRTMALGVLQALSAIGNALAGVITLNLGDLNENWRIAYFIGAAPALLVLWIRASVKEPEKWKEARAKAAEDKELGNITELFTDPVLKRNTLAAVLMATAGVGALWGVGFFGSDLLRGELMPHFDAKKVGFMVSIAFIVQNLGSFIGIYLFAVVADKFNRKTTFYLWFTLAWASIMLYFWGIQGSGQEAYGRALFLAPILGFCALGPFSGYSVYFPELFPTRLRATGCGFCYNAARILAAAAPFVLGKLATSLGGFAQAASVVCFIYLLGFIGTAIGPETKGKLLPA